MIIGSNWDDINSINIWKLGEFICALNLHENIHFFDLIIDLPESIRRFGWDDPQ